MGDRVAVGGGAAGPQGPGEALRSREWLRSTRSFCASQSSHPGSRELNAPHAADNTTLLRLLEEGEKVLGFWTGGVALSGLFPFYKTAEGYLSGSQRDILQPLQ